MFLFNSRNYSTINSLNGFVRWDATIGEIIKILCIESEAWNVGEIGKRVERWSETRDG